MDTIDDISISVKEISEATISLQRNIFDLRQETMKEIKVEDYLNSIKTSNGGDFKVEILDNGLMSLSYVSNKYAITLSKELLTLLFISMPPKFTANDVFDILSNINDLPFKVTTKTAQMVIKAFISQFDGHCIVKSKPRQRTVIQKK